MQLPPYVWPTAVIATCILAIWRGGDEERLGAGSILAAWALSMVAYRWQGGQLEWGIAIVDVALLVALGWLALRSARYWPIFAAGFHLLALATHLARGLDTGVSGWAYITAEIIWGYLVVFAIAYGAWTAPSYRQQAAA